MQLNANSGLPAAKRTPWNKGKLTGAKPPLRPKHVWSIRTKLQVEGRTRDLAPRDWARTSDLTVNSRPLYQLSYRGICTKRSERRSTRQISKRLRKTASTVLA